jgi:hypothetical protein
MLGRLVGIVFPADALACHAGLQLKSIVFEEILGCLGVDLDLGPPY